MNEQRKNPYRRPRSSADKPDRSRGPAPERRGIRRLPGEFQDLAEGKIERLSRPRRARGPLEDEREGAVIAGVRNSEARAVYDARVAALRSALASGAEAELEQGLYEVRQLALWRARSVTDFRAFAESVVGVPSTSIATLLERGEVEPLPAHAIALHIRVEAALLQRPPGGRVTTRKDENGVRLELCLAVDDVARSVEALSDVGRAVSGLRRFLRPDSPPERERSRDAGDRELRRPQRQPHADERKYPRPERPARVEQRRPTHGARDQRDRRDGPRKARWRDR